VGARHPALVELTSPNASRKSMVIHCFADDVLCYHELTQRAAMMEEDR